jgi:hypothetical protein
MFVIMQLFIVRRELYNYYVININFDDVTKIKKKIHLKNALLNIIKFLLLNK